MRGRRYSTEGVILMRRDYGEADRIITIFTKDFGKITLMAKGVKRLSSRKRGSLENFNRIKFSASKGKNMDIINEAEILDSFEDVRKSLNKASLAYYFCEVINKTTQDEEPHLDLYKLVIRNFKKLESETKLKKLREKFVGDLIVILGFWPKDKPIGDIDKALESVTERRISASRVGKKLLS